MRPEEVYQGVAEALGDVLGVEQSDITPTATLVGILQATSLDVVDLLFQLKRKFGIQLTLAEVQQELSRNPRSADSGDEASQGFSDALFERVTVQDVANWVNNRLPG